MRPSLFSLGMDSDIIFSFVVVFCSLVIYFKAEELYELSSHKGIKYFRDSFMFLSLSYSLRVLVGFFFSLYDDDMFHPFPSPWLGNLIAALFIYTTTMAIFSLIRSMVYKRLHKRVGGEARTTWLLNISSVLIAFTMLTFGLPAYLLGNLALAILMIAVIYNEGKIKRTRKKFGSIRTLYLLLSIFLILGMVDTLIPSFFMGFQILVYMASISVFLTLFYRVLRATELA